MLGSTNYQHNITPETTEILNNINMDSFSAMQLKTTPNMTEDKHNIFSNNTWH
jgi:Iap family predicted aminopeptidase